MINLLNPYRNEGASARLKGILSVKENMEKRGDPQPPKEILMEKKIEGGQKRDERKVGREGKLRSRTKMTNSPGH